MMKAQKTSLLHCCVLFLFGLAWNACQQNNIPYTGAAGDQVTLDAKPLYAFTKKTIAQSDRMSGEQTIGELLGECKRQMNLFEAWMSSGMIQPHQ